jgi:hypothetical protein
MMRLQPLFSRFVMIGRHVFEHYMVSKFLELAVYPAELWLCRWVMRLI